jgi:integrase
VREALDCEQLGVRTDLSLGEAVERYVHSIAGAGDERTSTLRARKLVGAMHDRWYLDPNTPLHRVTSAQVEQLRQARVAEGMAPASINREVAVLQRIYNLARLTWGARVAPDVRFEKFRERPKLRWLTEAEEAALLAELDPWRTIKGQPEFSVLSHLGQRRLVDQHDLTVLLLDTGARYSEIAGATWAAVDTDEWTHLEIYRSKVDNWGRLPLTARVRLVLARRWASRPNSPYVFPGFGTDGPRGHATRGITNAINRAGLNAPHLVERYGRCTVHSLRDTFASRLVQNGVSLFVIQQLLGHASPAMTQKYAHLAPSGAADEAAAVLNRLQEGTA